MRVAIVGCGHVSDQYFFGLRREPLELVACADLDLNRAEEKAAEHSVPRACSPEELMAHVTSYLQDPGLEREGRRRLVDLWCQPFDGQAGSRLAAGLLVLAVFLSVGAYVMVVLGTTGKTPAGVAGLVITLAAAYLGAHLVVRRFAPGADPTQITLSFPDADSIKVERGRQLLIKATNGTIQTTYWIE